MSGGKEGVRIKTDLKNASNPKTIDLDLDAIRELEKSMCNEANFQSLLLSSSPEQLATSRASFSAGRRIMLRYGSCR
jgi:hypothetical protein